MRKKAMVLLNRRFSVGSFCPDRHTNITISAPIQPALEPISAAKVPFIHRDLGEQMSFLNVKKKPLD